MIYYTAILSMRCKYWTFLLVIFVNYFILINFVFNKASCCVLGHTLAANTIGRVVIIILH